jgi:hypothetical protein
MINTLAFSLILFCMTGSGFAHEQAFPGLGPIPEEVVQNGL